MSFELVPHGAQEEGPRTELMSEKEERKVQPRANCSLSIHEMKWSFVLEFLVRNVHGTGPRMNFFKDALFCRMNGIT